MARNTVASLEAEVSRLTLLLTARDLEAQRAAMNFDVLSTEFEAVSKQLAVKDCVLPWEEQAPVAAVLTYKQRAAAARAQAMATGKVCRI